MVKQVDPKFGIFEIHGNGRVLEPPIFYGDKSRPNIFSIGFCSKQFARGNTVTLFQQCKIPLLSH